MFLELDLTLSFFIGTAIGILSIILIFLLTKKEKKELEISELENLNFEKRITPFIKIHQSLMEGNSETKFSDSVQHLKSKIDDFKLRNQFYKD